MLALVLPLAAGWVKTSDYNALVELYEATNGAAWEPMEEAPEEFTDPTLLLSMRHDLRQPSLEELGMCVHATG